jgi:photosystem II stability/assembly factor-like uncharacterized protein
VVEGGSVTDLWANANSFFAINSGGLHRSDDGGRTWDRMVAERSGYPHTLALHGDTLLHGVSKKLFRSFDNGKTWSADTGSAPTSGDYRLYFDGSHLVAWDTSRIYRSLDMGGSWTSIPAPARFGYPANHEVQAATCMGTLILGERQDFFRSRDGGATWSRMTVPGNSGLSALATAGSVLIGAAAQENHPGVYYSVDTGTTWKAYADGLHSQPIAFVVNGGTDMYLMSIYHAVYAGDVSDPSLGLLPAVALRPFRPRAWRRADILGRPGRPLFPMPGTGR